MTPRVTPAESAALPNPCGAKGVMLSALKSGSASSYERCERGHLDDDENDVERCALARSRDQQSGNGKRNQNRGQIDDAAGMWPG